MSAPWRWSSRPHALAATPGRAVEGWWLSCRRLRSSLEPEGGDDDRALDDLCDFLGHAVRDERVLQQLEHHGADHARPMTVTLPPVNGVPATATAAIASSSMPTPVLLASDAEVALTAIRPTSPARTPEVT